MYNYNVSPYHRRLIEKAIAVCKDLRVPIADSVTFNYCHGKGYIGQYLNETKIIEIDDRLIEKQFIETAIHELLHTIDNKKYSPHNGPWKKWAKHISDNSDYSIAVRYYGWFNNLTVLQNKKLQEKSKNERHCFIQDYLQNGTLSLEILSSFFPLANKKDTRELVDTVLLNYPFNFDILSLVEDSVRSDKELARQIVENYCSGRYEKTISTYESRVLFDSMFSLTDYYMSVYEYSNKAIL